MTRIIGCGMALLGVFLIAPVAAAQVCVGFPTGDRQFSFGGSKSFPEHASLWGAEASYNIEGPLSAFGGIEVNTFEGGGSTDTYVAGAAYEVTDMIDALPDSAGVCLTARVKRSNNEGRTIMQIPFGVGLGTTIPVSPTIPVMPYVVPQMVFLRQKPDADDEIKPGIRAGANVGFGSMFWIGAEVEKLFRPGADALFGIRGGIRL